MNISAKIIKDSINITGDRLTTFELEYPRFIHSELMTHRMLSKNCASSRAIPVNTMLDIVDKEPAMPVHWGKNQPGMSAKEELNGTALESAKAVWIAASKQAISQVRVLNDIGLHKQVANRITEPFQRMKTVLTGTEFANLFWLRHHEDAQPEFFELAKVMRVAYDSSKPKLLKHGEWHLPYVDDNHSMDLDTAQKVSASCCAQVSYRKTDDSVEKALMIYDKLVGLDRKHSSPFEHQGTPISPDMFNVVPSAWHTYGVTHMTGDYSHWSGNLKGWVQYRQLIPGHAVW